MLTVLMYHKVSEVNTDFLTVNSKQLKQQLVWLKARYHIITLSNLLAHIEHGTPLPPKALLITFDDGYENNYTLAYPIFKALNMPFSIFLVGSFINQTTMYDGQMQTFLNTYQLAEMSDIVEYGFHSISHQHLMNLPQNEWQQEIEAGVSCLQNLPVFIQKAWAYTYGGFPKKDKHAFIQLVQIFKKQNISCAFRIGNRKNRLPIKNPYAIQRIDIIGNDSFLRFKWKVLLGKIL